MTENKYMPLPDEASIGERYAPAMEMTDPEDARQYLEALIDVCVRVANMDEEEARKVQLSNLGYYASYYDYETRQRVQQLFGAVHPIFGSAKPTAEEAFKAGLELGKKGRKS